MASLVYERKIAAATRYVLKQIFKTVFSSTNQTTRNHERYPLVFHIVNFNLKLHD